MLVTNRPHRLLAGAQQLLAVIFVLRCFDAPQSLRSKNIPVYVAEAATASIRWSSVDDTSLYDFLLDRINENGSNQGVRSLQLNDGNISTGNISATTPSPTARPATNSPTVSPTEKEVRVAKKPLPLPEPKFPRCVYDGGEILMSHPMSIGKDDRHYALGSQMLNAAHISIDRINLYPRCGVTLLDETDGIYKNYSLAIQTYGDESSKDMTKLIGLAIVNHTDFMLAGYSSELTAELTPTAQQNRRLCITGGSSRTSVHSNRDYVFGLNPPSDAYLEYAFKGAYDHGAKTVAYIAEETASACSGTEEMAAKYNMTLIAGETIQEEAELEVFEAIARNMSILDPDLMITCVRTQLTYWNEAARNIDWTPKAQVYTYVVGTPEFEDLIPKADLPYIMGVSSWDRALPPIPDAALGWTPLEFDAEFEKAAFRRAAYQHVQQSAAISVLVQAMERVGSYKSQEAIRDVLASQYFPTVYGNVSFDENGQNAVPFLLLQYDADARLHVLYPETQKFTNFSMVYPLPGYSFRDCETLSDCAFTNGTCRADGLCECRGDLVSNGIKGRLAECYIPPTKVFDKKANLVLVIAVPLAAIALVVAGLFFYYIHLQKKQDKVWQIEKSELIFDDPPEIIGRGSFGEVTLAEYRGTKVAVKHIFPANKRKKRSTVHAIKNEPKNNDDEDMLRNNERNFSASGSSYASTDDSDDDFEATQTDQPERVQSVGMQSRRRSSVDQISNNNRRKDFIRDMRLLTKLRHPWYVSSVLVLTQSRLFCLHSRSRDT